LSFLTERGTGVDTTVIYTALISYGTRVGLAVVSLMVGLAVIRWICRLLDDRLERASGDPSLKTFLIPLTRVSLQVLLIISIASILGVAMTSFIAVIGAAGLAVGLALQGSLANFAGGVLILLLRPFRVGDFIEAAGHSGTVSEIQIFHTILNTPDNRRVIIPNANLSNTSTVNYSHNPTRRVDFSFGVGYGDDISRVKETLFGIAQEHQLIMDEPAPAVMLSELGDSAVVFRMRVWSRKEDYWTVFFEVTEAVKRAFDREGISIPYPQMDVHFER
jgi:small conductance mechanosensitive channel